MTEQPEQPRTYVQGRLDQAKRDFDAYMGSASHYFMEWLSEEIRQIEASTAIEAQAAAPEQDEAVRPESFNRCAWAAWIGPERDGDGQATTIHVSPTDGAHVTEADAEEVRARLRSASPPPAPVALTFAEFARVNRDRCESPEGFRHPLNGWSRSDWFLATFGELGEAANKAKKLNRYRDGIPGNTESEEELRAGMADEIADAVIYADLLAQSEGFDLGTIVASKFDRTSEKIGAPHRLARQSEDQP